MVNSQRSLCGRLLAVAVAVGLLWGAPAGAIYLDEEQTISFRTRIYSQAAIRIENLIGGGGNSSVDTFPRTEAGQLVQHRNFFNPELDANLVRYTKWMNGTFLSWLAPDQLQGRVAGWAFYDGIYDYGSSQFNESQRRINRNFPDATVRENAFILEGPEFKRPPPGQGGTFDSIFQGAELQNPRDIYADQRRVNELYLSYGKGPFFMRIGRQSISWGESDTIALLDQNNPFDVTLGAPGLFQDLDEARIPLWTARSSLNLFTTLGPFSSGFVEAYWVPGDLDVNTGILPIQTASPYSPRGREPQGSVPGAFPLQLVLLDRIPKKDFESSRYGFRFQTVLNRFFTLQAWHYTYFPSAPVPELKGVVRLTDGSSILVTQIVHKKTSTYGLSNTFFLEPLDGIVRMQVSYFENEPGFIPESNLCVTGNPTDSLTCDGKAEPADFVRWELGFDRFFFARALNPTNSFTFVSAIVGSWNLDETDKKDFRFQGQMKPGEVPPGAPPQVDNFVQLKEVEVFGQFTLQTDYLHGRLTPRMTTIGNLRGTYVLHPSVVYRWTDWLLFQLDLVHISGAYQQVGFFRDRDQVSFRVTYQLN
jgi:hypothetical protein